MAEKIAKERCSRLVSDTKEKGGGMTCEKCPNPADRDAFSALILRNAQLEIALAAAKELLEARAVSADSGCYRAFQRLRQAVADCALQ